MENRELLIGTKIKYTGEFLFVENYFGMITEYERAEIESSVRRKMLKKFSQRKKIDDAKSDETDNDE